MKYVKMLGLLAVAAAALMAFAATASATLTAPTDTVLKNSAILNATAGTTYFTGAFADVECKHSVIDATTSINGASVATATVGPMHFNTCNFTVTPEAGGTIEFKTTAKGTATVFSKNAVLTLHTSLGSCKIGTGGVGTHIGVLEDSHHKKNSTAVLNLNNSKIPVTGGSFLCGSTVEWEGSYTVTVPDKLYVD